MILWNRLQTPFVWGVLALVFKMIDIFHGQVELIIMLFPAAAVFRALVGKDAQQRNAVFFQKRNFLIIQ